MSEEKPEDPAPEIIPGTGITRLSVSQIGTYDRCPRAWAYSRISKIRPIMPGKVHSGYAMDKALNFYWRSRIENTPASVADVKTVFLNALMETAVLPALDTDLDAMNDGQRLIEIFMSDPDIIAMTPKQVQVELHYSVSGIPFVGHADLVTTSDGIGDIIADHKFTGRTPDRQKTERSIQLCLYSLALHGQGPRPVRLINLVRLKTKPKIAMDTHFVTDQQLEDTKRHVRSVFSRMKSGHYPMTSPENTYVCSNKSCSYWAICRGNPDGPQPITGEQNPQE